MNNTLLISLCMLFTQIAFSQTTVVLQASRDNTIYSEATNSNGAGQNFTTGKNSSGDLRRALLRFDLSSIPAGATINSVTLTLTLTKSKQNTDNVSLYKLTQNWGEGTSDAATAGTNDDGQGAPAQTQDATWSCAFFNGAGGCTTAWTTAGGVFNATASATTAVANASTTNTWSSAQMGADVQAWLNSPSTNFGWIIRVNVSAGNEGAATRTTNRFASRENTNAAIRPRLSVTYTASAAPVTMLSFNAIENKSGILLNWQTSQEFNNAYFLIEHSTDGVTFHNVGKINGAGTSATEQKYQFIHQGVNAGKHFYRLAQTNLNGSVQYSNVISVMSRSQHLQVTISPNPVRDVLTIGGFVVTIPTSYTIINSSGLSVQSGKLDRNQVRIGTLQTGFYLLRIHSGDKELSGTFLKQ